MSFIRFISFYNIVGVFGEHVQRSRDGSGPCHAFLVVKPSHWEEIEVDGEGRMVRNAEC